MTRPLPTREELLEELAYVKGKLNEQKVEITLLQRAVQAWRNGAAPKPIASQTVRWAAPLELRGFDERNTRAKADALRACLLQCTTLHPGKSYSLRIEEATEHSNELLEMDTYFVTIRIWEH